MGLCRCTGALTAGSSTAYDLLGPSKVVCGSRKEWEIVFLSGRLIWKAETLEMLIISNAMVTAS